MNMDNNLIKQAEEVEALSAIYGSEWITENEATKTYRIEVKVHKNIVQLQVTLPTNYPGESPPKYEVSAPWMERKVKQDVYNKLNKIYSKHVGEPIIFHYVEKVREILHTMKKDKNKLQPKVVPLESTLLDVKCPKITHGQVIVDRKSSFQGHAAQVHSTEEVDAFLNELKLIRKIQNAKHNIYAYRIERKTAKGSTILQDCDDDGEAHAAGRMLYLMQLLNQKNTMVVVTRWYGGIHLGPDRFKHINNATRQVLQQAGFLKTAK